jgi:hypothetical protein
MLWKQKSRLFCRDAKLDIFIDLLGRFVKNRMIYVKFTETHLHFDILEDKNNETA